MPDNLDDDAGSAPLMNPERRFRALLMLYERHSELLQFMSRHDLQMFGGYITLQLALGGWLAQPPALTLEARIAIGVIDAAMASLAAALIQMAYRRRKEISDLFENLNEALEFTREGAYLRGRSLWPETAFRPWRRWYLFGISLAFAGVLVLLVLNGSRT